MAPLKERSLRERITLDIAPDGIVWVGSEGEILLVNPAMETLTGYSETDLLGKRIHLLLPHHLREGHERHTASFFEHPRARAMGNISNMALTRKDGTSLPVDVSLGYWTDSGEQFAVAYIRDLTDRKRYEESLQHLAAHDELTQLPNRRLLRVQLEMALAQANRSSKKIAVVLLDLDAFKQVNDAFGHSVGDHLLVEVSQRLRAILRVSDTLARMGGDEFVIVLPNLDREEEALIVTEKLLLAFEQPFVVDDREVFASGSFGIAFFPRDAKDSETLMRFADLAMYQAKQAGRAGYACYSEELDQHAQRQLVIKNRLKDALTKDALRLDHQPQLDTETGVVIGAEALLRWRDELLGDVSPATFIPIAEGAGLIGPLSDFVLRTACKLIAELEQAGTPLKIAVNISAQQFQGLQLCREVASVLEQTGANPRFLEIEITETAAMAQPLAAATKIRDLTRLGCSVALDDFGQGYSSLGLLKDLPISTLKVPKEFIQSSVGSVADARVTKAITSLAHDLGLRVTAEGVETLEQLEFVRELECESWQGWHFSAALDSKRLMQLLNRGKDP